MKKSKLEDLMKKADSIVKNSSELQKDGYDNQVAAFAVTVAMSGLRPALAIFHKDADKFKRIEILNAIAQMIDSENWAKEKESGKKMSRDIFSSDEKAEKYKTEIIDCAIALKQVIRTY